MNCNIESHQLSDKFSTVLHFLLCDKENKNIFENDKIKLMNLILEKKNKLVNLEGNTVLFVACEQFQIENISLLLENKNIDLGENSIKM